MERHGRPAWRWSRLTRSFWPPAVATEVQAKVEIAILQSSYHQGHDESEDPEHEHPGYRRQWDRNEQRHRPRYIRPGHQDAANGVDQHSRSQDGQSLPRMHLTMPGEPYCRRRDTPADVLATGTAPHVYAYAACPYRLQDQAAGHPGHSRTKRTTHSPTLSCRHGASLPHRDLDFPFCRIWRVRSGVTWRLATVAQDRRACRPALPSADRQLRTGPRLASGYIDREHNAE